MANQNQNNIDAEWDEHRNGDRNPFNLISFPKDGDFAQATKHVSWRPVEHDAW